VKLRTGILQQLASERDALEPVTHTELRERVKKSLVTVLDVPPAEEFKQGHVPGGIAQKRAATAFSSGSALRFT
jgi:rhodanese-related sulfurtransferase